MLKVPDIFDQQKHDLFSQDKTLLVILGVSKYDQVLKKRENGQVLPAYPPVGKTSTMCSDVQETLAKYGVKDQEDIFTFVDSTFAQFLEVLDEVLSKIEEANSPKDQRKLLVIWMIAGQGIVKDGSTHLLMNEMDPRKRFFKTLPIEDII